MSGGGRIAVLAPHPDDEVLGCGRLIAQAARRRMGLAVVVLTDGQASHPQSDRFDAKERGRIRRGESRHGLGRLGAHRVALHFMGARDGRLSQEQRPLALALRLQRLRARMILCSSPLDHHPDHQAAWSLAAGVAARLGIPARAYRVWSGIASNAIARAGGPGAAAKAWAMRAHRSQSGALDMGDPSGFCFEPMQLATMLAARESVGINRCRHVMAPRGRHDRAHLRAAGA